MTNEKLQAQAKQLNDANIVGIKDITVLYGEVAAVVEADNLIEAAIALRDSHHFEQLIDVCAVDYLHYGVDEWETGGTGFSRGVSPTAVGRLSFGDEVPVYDEDKPRFAAVYHLLSIKNNARLRLKVYAADNEFPVVPSVVDVWSSANWPEREAFDLMGVHFDGHPDLRRLLTDYGFVGHPFRKDFPLIGNVEMRYDPQKKRVIYEPVTIEPRILVPRVIRKTTKGEEPAAPESPDDAVEGKANA